MLPVPPSKIDQDPLLILEKSAPELLIRTNTTIWHLKGLRSLDFALNVLSTLLVFCSPWNIHFLSPSLWRCRLIKVHRFIFVSWPCVCYEQLKLVMRHRVHLSPKKNHDLYRIRNWEIDRLCWSFFCFVWDNGWRLHINQWISDFFCVALIKHIILCQKHKMEP